MVEVKKCRFCSSNPEVTYYPTLTIIECKCCGLKGITWSVTGEGPYSAWCKTQKPSKYGTIIMTKEAKADYAAVNSLIKMWNDLNS